MKAFTTFAIAAAMTAATATVSIAGDKTTAGTDDPFIAPVVPAGSSGSLGGGYLPVVAGVAAAALIAAAIASDSDNDSPATTTTGSGE